MISKDKKNVNQINTNVNYVYQHNLTLIINDSDNYGVDPIFEPLKKIILLLI